MMITARTLIWPFLAISSSAIQLHWSPQDNVHDRHLQDGQTLRAFLDADDFHAALAPIRCSTIIHLSILHVLKSNNLSSRIKSLSGTSTGGIAAAIWASSAHKEASNDLVSIFGEDFSKATCGSECTWAQRYYSNLLDSPTSSETNALAPAIVPTAEDIKLWTRNFPRGFQRVPTLQESHMAWVQTMLFIDLLKIPPKFSDTYLPVVVTGHHVKDYTAKTLLMSKGNLHIALLATASPPGCTQPVWVDDQFRVTDGYFGDEHGARGYDAVEPELRPSSLLDILLFDMESQDVSMNFTRLQAHTQLKKAATVEMSIGAPMMFHMAPYVHKKGYRPLTYRDLVTATKKAWNVALDSPLTTLDSPDPGMQLFLHEIDLQSYLPEMRGTVPAMLRQLDTAWSGWRMQPNKRNDTVTNGNVAEGPDPILGREVVDTKNLLGSTDLLTAYQRFKEASSLMYSGDAFQSPDLGDINFWR